MQKVNIKVEGHRGTWYVINEKEYNGKKLFFLEHERYGDEAAGIIIDEDGKLIAEECWNGFNDYEEQTIGSLEENQMRKITTLTTPRGTFNVTEEFCTKKEAEDAGYGFYFTHYDEQDNPIDIYTKPIENKIHCHYFAIIRVNYHN